MDVVAPDVTSMLDEGLEDPKQLKKDHLPCHKFGINLDIVNNEANKLMNHTTLNASKVKCLLTQEPNFTMADTIGDHVMNMTKRTRKRKVQKIFSAKNINKISSAIANHQLDHISVDDGSRLHYRATIENESSICSSLHPVQQDVKLSDSLRTKNSADSAPTSISVRHTKQLRTKRNVKKETESHVCNEVKKKKKRGKSSTKFVKKVIEEQQKPVRNRNVYLVDEELRRMKDKGNMMQATMEKSSHLHKYKGKTLKQNVDINKIKKSRKCDNAPLNSNVDTITAVLNHVVALSAQGDYNDDSMHIKMLSSTNSKISNDVVSKGSGRVGTSSRTGNVKKSKKSILNAQNDLGSKKVTHISASISDSALNSSSIRKSPSGSTSCVHQPAIPICDTSYSKECKDSTDHNINDYFMNVDCDGAVNSVEGGNLAYRVFQCKKCLYKSKKKVSLRRHMTVHGVYECAHCNFVSEQNIQYEDHMRDKHPSRCGRKLCKKCNVLFRIDEMDQHDKDCTGEKKKWACSECTKEFKFLCAMRAHVQKWHISAGLKCDHCEFEANTSFLMKKHMAKQHKPLKEKKTVVCTQCHKSFSSDSCFKQHMRIHGTQEFDCPKCKKTFKSTRSLSTHIKTHDAIKSVHCNYKDCVKVFKNTKVMEIHRKRCHENEPKKFKCTHANCEQKFYTKYHLRRHEIMHTGERNYKCTFTDCNKAFHHAENLKVHLRSHNNIKCPLCRRTFKEEAGLQMHIKVHENAKSRRKKKKTVPVNGIPTSKCMKINKCETDTPADINMDYTPSAEMEALMCDVGIVLSTPDEETSMKPELENSLNVYDFHDSEDEKVDVSTITRQVSPNKSHCIKVGAELLGSLPLPSVPDLILTQNSCSTLDALSKKKVFKKKTLTEKMLHKTKLIKDEGTCKVVNEESTKKKKHLYLSISEEHNIKLKKETVPLKKEKSNKKKRKKHLKVERTISHFSNGNENIKVNGPLIIAVSENDVSPVKNIEASDLAIAFNSGKLQSVIANDAPDNPQNEPEIGPQPSPPLDYLDDQKHGFFSPQPEQMDFQYPMAPRPMSPPDDDGDDMDLRSHDEAVLGSQMPSHVDNMASPLHVQQGDEDIERPIDLVPGLSPTIKDLNGQEDTMLNDIAKQVEAESKDEVTPTYSVMQTSSSQNMSEHPPQEVPVITSHTSNSIDENSLDTMTTHYNNDSSDIYQNSNSGSQPPRSYSIQGPEEIPQHTYHQDDPLSAQSQVLLINAKENVTPSNSPPVSKFFADGAPYPSSVYHGPSVSTDCQLPAEVATSPIAPTESNANFSDSLSHSNYQQDAPLPSYPPRDSIPPTTLATYNSSTPNSYIDPHSAPLISHKDEGSVPSVGPTEHEPIYMASPRSNDLPSAVTETQPAHTSCTSSVSYPSEPLTSSREFGQYYALEESGSVPLTHPPMSHQQRVLPYAQPQTSPSLHPANADFFRRPPGSFITGTGYPSGTESLVVPPPQNWMSSQDDRSRHWSQSSPLMHSSVSSDMDSASPVTRNPYTCSRPTDYSLTSVTTTSVTSKPTESSYPSTQTTTTPSERSTYDMASAYRTFNPNYSGPMPPATTQKQLEEAYRRAAQFTDYRTLSQAPSSVADMYSRMTVPPGLGFDKYYYSRDAVFRTQHLPTAPNPFMPQTSTSQMAYGDREYGRNHPIYSQHSAYGFMGDKQYLQSKGLSGLQERPMTADYLQSSAAMSDAHIQDPYRRSVIYNMMSRYF